MKCWILLAIIFKWILKITSLPKLYLVNNLDIKFPLRHNVYYQINSFLKTWSVQFSWFRFRIIVYIV